MENNYFDSYPVYVGNIPDNLRNFIDRALTKDKKEVCFIVSVPIYIRVRNSEWLEINIGVDNGYN